MKYNKLRIAWSVACGILCLPLIAQWVQSYSDGGGWYPLTRPGVDHSVYYESASGEIRLLAWDRVTLSALQPDLTIPYWSLVSGGIFLAAIPWLRRSFSLSTMLIAMTLV